MTISANEVKKNGVSIFERLLKKANELIITVRGKQKFVVLDIDRYNEFRKYELDIAYLKAKDDIKNRNFKEQSAKEHISELLNELQNS